LNKLFSQDAGEVPHLKSDLVAARKETKNLRAAAIEADGKVGKTHQEKMFLLAQLDAIRSVENALTQEVSGMRRQLSKLEEELAAANAEIELWRHRGTELQLNKDKSDSEVSRLTAELGAAQNVAAQALWLRSEVTRLTNEMSRAAIDLQAGVQEKGRLNAEVARLTATLFSAYADLRNTLRGHQIAKHDLRQVQAALQNSAAPREISLG
jgi:predicted  nucleic acid-binding Zn-ribbon protein